MSGIGIFGTGFGVKPAFGPPQPPKLLFGTYNPPPNSSSSQTNSFQHLSFTPTFGVPSQEEHRPGDYNKMARHEELHNIHPQLGTLRTSIWSGTQQNRLQFVQPPTVPKALFQLGNSPLSNTVANQRVTTSNRENNLTFTQLSKTHFQPQNTATLGSAIEQRVATTYQQNNPTFAQPLPASLNIFQPQNTAILGGAIEHGTAAPDQQNTLTSTQSIPAPRVRLPPIIAGTLNYAAIAKLQDELEQAKLELANSDLKIASLKEEAEKDMQETLKERSEKMKATLKQKLQESHHFYDNQLSATIENARDEGRFLALKELSEAQALGFSDNYSLDVARVNAKLNEKKGELTSAIQRDYAEKLKMTKGNFSSIEIQAFLNENATAKVIIAKDIKRALEQEKEKTRQEVEKEHAKHHKAYLANLPSEDVRELLTANTTVRSTVANNITKKLEVEVEKAKQDLEVEYRRKYNISLANIPHEEDIQAWLIKNPIANSVIETKVRERLDHEVEKITTPLQEGYSKDLKDIELRAKDREAKATLEAEKEASLRINLSQSRDKMMKEKLALVEEAVRDRPDVAIRVVWEDIHQSTASSTSWPMTSDGEAIVNKPALSTPIQLRKHTWLPSPSKSPSQFELLFKKRDSPPITADKSPFRSFEAEVISALSLPFTEVKCSSELASFASISEADWNPTPILKSWTSSTPGMLPKRKRESKGSNLGANSDSGEKGSLNVEKKDMESRPTKKFCIKHEQA
ncbi:hypothetical protein G7Y89_g7904 [Cudoniella acicularis]|uniref:Uncharacterized protein n=1 Tax=Cudoniella acicularis TaxID=354080 RepID=A0A8H4W3D0_9HELO|nr:hypothetical protein G7Y89_g7904 [Cudoniella acicularis]